MTKQKPRKQLEEEYRVWMFTAIALIMVILYLAIFDIPKITNLETQLSECQEQLPQEESNCDSYIEGNQLFVNCSSTLYYHNHRKDILGVLDLEGMYDDCIDDGSIGYKLCGVIE